MDTTLLLQALADGLKWPPFSLWLPQMIWRLHTRCVGIRYDRLGQTAGKLGAGQGFTRRRHGRTIFEPLHHPVHSQPPGGGFAP